ncbi:MAG: 16S rRNA (adenine(1518)-N(6)/adenine(1519)-N(6))-dimethyltransferase RsmA [Dysgonamonadaceae bacterium]|jgi:16S rRNA (adenine1518-N6/adenine1519-N6)-dimethyltransferase|nr:16S rRNA (adenine(1518)-N(6)/adenine(1519)-N(6))-dimethyltransferase RsmA [Dysgonamonadaceae bacterium]
MKYYNKLQNSQYRRKVHPKKTLGQHFLKDLSVAEKVADSISVVSGLPVLEVGPGTGSLTQFLLKNNRPLKVVEVDSESIQYLKTHFPDLAGQIIEKDFLQLDLESIFSTPFCVIGNYPYNISSQIFFKVLEYRNKIPCCAGMFQKEVAERLAARPGRKAYGIITVLLQAWYNVEYLFTVEPEVFDPPPRVKSAVIRITRNSRTELNCDENLFKMIVKTAFNQRRKTLRNSLKGLLKKENEIFSHPVFDKRPEQLSVEEFIDLTKIFQ